MPQNINSENRAKREKKALKRVVGEIDDFVFYFLPQRFNRKRPLVKREQRFFFKKFLRKRKMIIFASSNIFVH